MNKLRKPLSPENQLREALLDAFNNSSRELTEREALEIADSIAEGWRMRLQELEDE